MPGTRGQLDLFGQSERVRLGGRKYSKIVPRTQKIN